jgi:YHS domain-containing protein
MMQKSISLTSAFYMLITVLAFTFSMAAQADQTGPALKPVDSNHVCMITDQEFAREQIPVEVEGKTYYGCCEMCKAKLNNNPESRVATDPVSGNNVDKAEAVIGAAPDGKVYYFESEENLTEFDPSSGS